MPRPQVPACFGFTIVPHTRDKALHTKYNTLDIKFSPNMTSRLVILSSAGSLDSELITSGAPLPISGLLRPF